MKEREDGTVVPALHPLQICQNELQARLSSSVERIEFYEENIELDGALNEVMHAIGTQVS